MRLTVSTTWDRQFDKHISMSVHIGRMCSKAFGGIYKIRQIRKFLSVDITKT